MSSLGEGRAWPRASAAYYRSARGLKCPLGNAGSLGWHFQQTSRPSSCKQRAQPLDLADRFEPVHAGGQLFGLIGIGACRLAPLGVIDLPSKSTGVEDQKTDANTAAWSASEFVWAGWIPLRAQASQALPRQRIGRVLPVGPDYRDSEKLK